MNWVDYWNGKPTIYVSRRHQETHDAGIAESVARFVEFPNARVLDYGCGDATSAARVAENCSVLYLWDAAESVRARLTDRYASNASIKVLGSGDLAALQDGSIDLITIVSVVQYLDDEALAGVLSECRRLLGMNGKLLIGDVIPPDVSIVQDAWQLLRFGHREGFAIAAFIGLARTALSGYLSMRSKMALRKHTSAQFLTLLATHGFSGRLLEQNIGHNQLRNAYLASRIASQSVADPDAASRTCEPA